MIAIAYTLVLLWPAGFVTTARTESIQAGISTLAECSRLGHKLYDGTGTHIPWECIETKVFIPTAGR